MQEDTGASDNWVVIQQNQWQQWVQGTLFHWRSTTCATIAAMLTLWKRHSDRCEEQLKKNRKVAADQRRFFKQCTCACWITGVHPITKEYVKKALGTTSWEAAEKVKARMEDLTPEAIDAEGLTVAQAIQRWMDDKVRLGTASTTMRNFEALQEKILAYAKDHGVVLLRQFTGPRVYDMATAWTGKPATCAMRISRIREFFTFAKKREWLDKDLGADVVRPSVPREQVEPYTREEEQRLEAALDTWTTAIKRLKGGRWSARPSTFKALVHILQDTGLRISDAIRVRPEIVELADKDGNGKFTIEQMKSDRRGGGEVTCYLRESTWSELKACPRLSAKYPFMLECSNERDRNLWKEHVNLQAQRPREALRFLGKAAGVKECRPHRFRHTLAYHKLKDHGWRLEDVQKLLGHKSLSMTEKYYAKWTNERQKLIEEKVLDDWRDNGTISITRGKKKGAA